MDRLITATEANQRFSELLRDVAEGETFIVTSRGKPVARVLPVENASQAGRVATLLAHLESLPFRVSAAWKREDLYD